MRGQAILEVKLAPTRISVSQRGPVRIGQVLPALLERYGVETPRPTVNRLHVQMAAVGLGQKSLASLAELS